MKKIILLLTGILTIAFFTYAGAQTSPINGPDKSFFELLKKIEQEPANKKAIRSLPFFYDDAEQSHLQNIKDILSAESNIDYNRILTEYTTLQSLFDAIVALPAANKLITPTNYSSLIEQTRQQGAADAYSKGMAFLTADKSRAGKTKAYNCFKNAVAFEPGYKDSKDKMEEAWKKSVVTILVNPVDDRSAFLESGSQSMDNYAFNEIIQRALAADLSKKLGTRYNARLLTTQTANEKQQADWVVTIVLTEVTDNARVKEGRTVSATPEPNELRAVTQDPVTGASSFNSFYNQPAEPRPGMRQFTAKMKVSIADGGTGSIISAAMFTNTFKLNPETDPAAIVKDVFHDAGYNYPAANTAYKPGNNEMVLCEIYKKSFYDISKIIDELLAK